MIIMINGAFGAGKTSAASALQPKIANSMVYDPEEIGYMLRKLLPEEHREEQERTDDFQDIELWRVLTVKIAREVKQKYNKHLIIPMTIYKKENFDYIYNGLKEIDQDLHHFCLTASLDTIYERLAKRGDQFGGWQYQQASKCVEAFKADVFETRICTDELETGDVIDIILEKVKG
ncbi:AAA family ATPase [Paenibacillus silvae]|uniref:AAA family ATPase n=1 Tax=Paenibacillus silvae TaxID=1325358 RepID=UPI0011AAD601|nr:MULTISPECIES: AAA family ATPase [Paenibacillus]MCK6073852.1 AAA family ATPase [Paenibacillus silvae]MCK6148672.1 AAA family ATPase [Paenibacillus silvae]MCK6266972.1 AAA family ATPase [Paenibacillus silvae]